MPTATTLLPLQRLGIADAVQQLSVIHVAGTKGKVGCCCCPGPDASSGERARAQVTAARCQQPAMPGACMAGAASEAMGIRPSLARPV